VNKNILQNLSGSQASVLGALAGGAEIMFGYPITPATEILQGWVEKCQKDASLSYLQTEDETSAGFGVIGAILAGKKAFTASAGPGNVLLQDPISMAENLRLPFVGIMMQRGGPSTGTVNYSQQEVTLTAFGGNGNGLRIVYSASNIAEMHDLTSKAFSTAWKYRFPTFVLGDGYLGKMSTKVNISDSVRSVTSTLLLKEQSEPTYLRNCYSSEESFADMLKDHISDWNRDKDKISESESYKCKHVSELVIAHGIVAEAAKEAINSMGSRKIGLFRPITLNPFPTLQLKKVLQDNKIKKIFIIESALAQLSRITKYELFDKDIQIIEIDKPALGFTPEDIKVEIGKI